MAHKKSIKTRLIIIPILVVIIAFTFIGGFFSNLSKKQLLEQMKQDGFTLTNQIVHRLDDSKNAINSLHSLLDDKILSTGSYIVPKFYVVLRKPLKIDIFAEPTKNSSSYSYILTLFTPLPQHI